MVVLAAIAYAQISALAQQEPFLIDGFVSYNGVPVNGADVYVTGTNNHYTSRADADGNPGYYQFGILAGQTVNVSATYNGQTIKSRDIIADGQSMELVLNLSITGPAIVTPTSTPSSPVLAQSPTPTPVSASVPATSTPSPSPVLAQSPTPTPVSASVPATATLAASGSIQSPVLKPTATATGTCFNLCPSFLIWPLLMGGIFTIGRSVSRKK